MHLAVHFGLEAPLRGFLQQPSINVNSFLPREGKTPVLIAASHGYEDVMRALLEKEDIDLTATNYNVQDALRIAAMGGHEGIDLNGRTALFQAAHYGHEEVVRLLVEESGINISLEDDYKNTALSRATEERFDSIVELLRRAQNTGINSKDHDENASLSNAVE
ncbi:Similar to E3 ubiquitin-protein ligase mib1; acc. no. Q6GNY1 [Pyronema omphalodes CBS 100304]|uniref:Similar to E3 ubiquitin-protein ligase mib1 acc. no. Q6GNY1 n=1 Tax=Pyronema omphalodes (strain CBS 100304) TaxID=1076935 RepID=U4LQQ4_PYROM|nr:Similar to E3 ubiquitin-protein ligase mib1; acc. no. Q6GNY1 [Pyronema omphalodes CBS 100304]